MKRTTLELLCCPDCRAPLHLRDERGDGTVEEGSLCCSSCRTGFPINNGTAHFISAEELAGRNRQFARFYDWFSRFEALSFRVFSLPAGGERKVRGEVLDRLDRDAGRILEVSVGSGGNLRYLFERPALSHVCGLDISAGQLACCRKVVARQGWPVDLFLATAERIPFKSETTEERATVTISKTTGYAQTELIYQIDMTRDLIEKITISCSGIPGAAAGELRFSYPESIEETVEDMPERKPMTREVAASNEGMLWLIALAEGTLLD